MRSAGLTVLLLLAPITAQAQDAPVQTADPVQRGLKQSDFPRLKTLAPNVYAYEELRPSDPGTFKTTVNLIVVTSGGVLVADGQGNLAATEKLVAQIKKLTPLPVKYVVVCSEHEDHTGGNAAFRAAFPMWCSSPRRSRKRPWRPMPRRQPRPWRTGAPFAWATRISRS